MREIVVDQYIGEHERGILESIHGHENRSNGLWLTDGSQEALKLMLDAFKANRKDKSKPVELVVTDPTYAGFLVAAGSFLDEGSLKLRVVPLNPDGSVNLSALDDALNNPNSIGVYLAEGNPMPKEINNKAEMAQMMKEKHSDKAIIEDRAYRGLGANEENTFMRLAPEQTIVYETVSKKASPGLRVGIVYTGLPKESSAKFQQAMTSSQFANSLGLPGYSGGVLAAILELDQENGLFKNHVEKVAANYRQKREVFGKSYEEMLRLAFGNHFVSLDDEIDIDIGMFGWRNTHHVDATQYADAGAEMGLISLPGSECIPTKDEYILGPGTESSPSRHRMRQNLTWDSESAIQIGVAKDVMLQVIFSDMDPLDKEQTCQRLLNRAEEISKSERPEIRKLLLRVSQNGWSYVSA